MRISVAALGCAALLFVGSAVAADDPMANTYANTVNTTNKANGQKGTLLFNQDGSYGATAMTNDGKTIQYTGHWELKDGGATICLTPNPPPNATQPPAASCSPLQKHNVGDSWTVTNNQNETYDVSISAGR